MSHPHDLLLHFLATLEYRTTKALRDAPADFGDYHAGAGTRTPSELITHMISLMSYTLVALGGSAGESSRETRTFLR